MKILFRGKRKDTGEWIYGFYRRQEGCHEIQSLYIGAEDGLEYFDVPVEVIPESVGQFTGLTDKNGKKIFEGDRINFTFFTYVGFELEELKRGIVVFEKGSFIFKIDDDESYIFSELNFDSSNEIEVIGTIHDEVK